MPPKRLPVFEKPAWLKSLLPVNLKPFSGGANGRAWVNLKEFAFKVRFTGGEGDLGASSEERLDDVYTTAARKNPTRHQIRVVSLRGAQKRTRATV